MNSAKILLGSSVLAFGLVLSGCQSNPSAAPKPTPTPSGSAVKVVPTPIVARDPYFLDFDKLSAKLTPEHEAQLQKLIPQLKAGKAFVVRGYSNKKEVGNAKDGALARALNVEKYLIEQGVPDKKMSVRYTTEDSKHGVEIDING